MLFYLLSPFRSLLLLDHLNPKCFHIKKQIILYSKPKITHLQAHNTMQHETRVMYHSDMSANWFQYCVITESYVTGIMGYKSIQTALPYTMAELNI
jgi:hypothetical protein